MITQLLAPIHTYLLTEWQCPHSTSSCCKTSLKKKKDPEWCLHTGFSPPQQQNWFCNEEVKIPLLKTFAPPEAQSLMQVAKPQSHLWLLVIPMQVTRGLRGLEPGKESTGLVAGLQGWEPLRRLRARISGAVSSRGGGARLAGAGQGRRAAGRLGPPVPPSGHMRKR